MIASALTDQNNQTAGRKHIVLCASILGGAEIFTLERLLQCNLNEVVLHCNSSLTRIIRKDLTYSNIKVVSEDCLDGLASQINVANIASGVGGLRSVFDKGSVLLGNLRAAVMMLHPAVARRNIAFIHDNSHYLNLKTRAMIACIVYCSSQTFFPCRHSTLKVPVRFLLSRHIAIDYFGVFRPLDDMGLPRPKYIKIAVVGRIEPAKNQKLALDIANCMASCGVRVRLTLVGCRSDEAYYLDITAAHRHPALEITQQEVTRSEIPDVLQQQDIILHTSIAESLPLVLFEANSLGIPFFALPVGGIPEVLPKKYWINVDIQDSVRQIMTTLYCA